MSRDMARSVSTGYTKAYCASMQPSSHNLLELRGPLARRSSKRHWFFSWPTVLLLLIVVGVLMSGVWSAYKKDVLAREKLSEAAREREEMTVRHSALKEKLDMLATPEGKEALLRAQYDVGREGEELVVMINDDSKNMSPPASRSPFKRFFDMVW